MSETVFATIASILATLLVIVNIYNVTVRKSQENYENQLRGTEKALNEFITTQSGEYAVLRKEVDTLVREVAMLKDDNKQLRIAYEGLARDLMRHELTTEKEVNNK